MNEWTKDAKWSHHNFSVCDSIWLANFMAACLGAGTGFCCLQASRQIWHLLSSSASPPTMSPVIFVPSCCSVWLPAVAQAFLPGCLHSFVFFALPRILTLLLLHCNLVFFFFHFFCFNNVSHLHCMVYDVSGEGEGQQAQTGDVGLELDLADASASSTSAPGAGPPKDGAATLAIAGRHNA